MTTAPSHPHVHFYDPGKDPMEMVETKSGKMERWRADALLIGETSALLAMNDQVRNDTITAIANITAREADLNARDDAISARERAHAVSVARFTDFVARTARMLDKLEKLRADAIAGKDEPLAHPPGDAPGDDPTNRSKFPEPSLELEDDAPAHHPGGELHAIAAKDPEQQDLPAEDEAEFPDPELPRPPMTHPQPIAAELDNED
jgi:hypothetical protein